MCDHGLSRRRVLRGTVGLGAVALAGCLGGGEETPAEAPDPIALDDGQTCDVCGMIIAEGYGPNGQVAYDGDYPPDRDGLAHYDSVRELYADRFAQADRGTDAIVTYVTDYSTVDYEMETRDGDRYITGSVAADTFVEASAVVFVADSGVQGAMGADFLPFSQRSDAEAFVDAEGGRVVEDVTPDLVG
jgi:copper chaperone NosL